MSKHDVFLVDTDLKELAALLVKARASGGMTLEEADGFLCALACVSDTKLPGRYFPSILGDVRDGLPLLSEPELKRLLALLMSLYSWRVGSVRKESDFVPLLDVERQDEAGKAWAASFLGCINAHKGLDALDDKGESLFFLPLFALAHGKVPEANNPTLFEPLTPEQREEALEAIPRCVGGLYRAFHEEVPSSAIQEKLSRNSPCPCGSGKKYKKCCLTASGELPGQR